MWLVLLGAGLHETVCFSSESGVLLSLGPVGFLGGLLFPLPDLQAGEPDVGLRTFTPVGEILWCNYFPVYEFPTWQVWHLILLLWRAPFTLLSWLILCLWM